MGILNSDLGKYIYIIKQGDFIPTEREAELLSGATATAEDTSTEEEADILVLSATTSFSKSESASVTNFPVADGTARGDHYRRKGPTINFSGVIGPSLFTLFSIFGDAPPSPQEYISSIRELLKGKDANGNEISSLVTIYMPDGNIEVNCVITNFKITRDVTVSDGYKVDITAQRILLATEDINVVAATPTVEETKNNGGDTPKQTPSKDIAAPEVQEAAALAGVNTGVVTPFKSLGTLISELPVNLQNVYGLF